MQWAATGPDPGCPGVHSGRLVLALVVVDTCGPLQFLGVRVPGAGGELREKFNEVNFIPELLCEGCRYGAEAAIQQIKGEITFNFYITIFLIDFDRSIFKVRLKYPMKFNAKSKV